MSEEAQYIRDWFAKLREVRVPQLAAEEKALLEEVAELERQHTTNDKLRQSEDLDTIRAEVVDLRTRETELRQSITESEKEAVRLFKEIVQRAKARDDYKILLETDELIKSRGHKRSVLSMSASELRSKLPRLANTSEWRQSLVDSFKCLQEELEDTPSATTIADFETKKVSLSAQIAEHITHLRTEHKVSQEVLDALKQFSKEQANTFLSDFISPTIERAEKESTWQLPERVIPEDG